MGTITSLLGIVGTGDREEVQTPLAVVWSDFRNSSTQHWLKGSGKGQSTCCFCFCFWVTAQQESHCLGQSTQMIQNQQGKCS